MGDKAAEISRDGPAIRVEGVSKTYQSRSGSQVLAIEDATFDVRPGEFVSIVGPSGCGKSTLLKIMAGLVPLSGGRILIGGNPVTGPSRAIGMIFQNPVLLPWKTVFENVILPIEVMRLPRARYESRVAELIRLVGLEGFENSYPFELSGGMAQRAAIIRALVHEPEILLADEPFGALDAMTRELMNIEFQRIWLESQKTILFVTHSIPEAIFLADTVVVLKSRPSRVADVVGVDFDRPRSIDLMATDRFGHYVRRVRAQFFEQEPATVEKAGDGAARKVASEF